MARFTSRDLMVSVMPEDSDIQLMAGPKGCEKAGPGNITGCTNPTKKKLRPDVSAPSELARLQEQLTLAQL